MKQVFSTYDSRLVAKALDSIDRGVPVREVSRSLNVPESTLRGWRRKHSQVREPVQLEAESGVPALGTRMDMLEIDGSVEIVTDRPLTLDELCRIFRIDRTIWVAEWFKPNVWQQGMKAPDGTPIRQNLYQTKAVFRRAMHDEVCKAIREFMQNEIRPAKGTPRRATSRVHDSDEVLVWGIYDAHLGMQAWHEETGENFDLDIAVSRVMNSIDDMIDDLKGRKFARVWMPIGNDFMHFDTVKAKTTFGEHHLDTDTRYGKVFVAAFACLEYMVSRAAESLGPVDGIYVPGNHDYHSAYALAYALNQRFINDDRIKVDCNVNPRKYRKWGKTLIGFDHGQKITKQQLARIMAEECSAVWSDTWYREWHIGHTHQRASAVFEGVTPTNGITVRTHPCLSGVDMFHHQHGMIGEPVKSVEAHRYDKTGYRGTHCTWVRDDSRSVSAKSSASSLDPFARA